MLVPHEKSLKRAGVAIFKANKTNIATKLLPAN